MASAKLARRRLSWGLVILAVFLARGVWAPGVSGQSKTGVVQTVYDGDTVRLTDGRRVRYLGIDTPEMFYRNPNKSPEPYARKATKLNRQLVSGQQVVLKTDTQLKDKYDRLLAHVYLEDGTWVNAKLLEEGLARVLIIPPNVRHRDKFLKLQRKAQKEKKGIWNQSQ